MPVLAAPRVWAIVPAAGRGERFTASAPGLGAKQYAPLLGATVLEWSLRALLAEPRVHAVVVALAADDAEWPGVAAKLQSPKLRTTIGGVNRQDTVANGLDALAEEAAAGDWVLVHDAARPCLNATDLGALLDAVGAGAARPAGAAASAGAVLAAPIVDTVKRELGDHVATVDRQGLWRALTPQVFAFAELRHALKEASLAGIAVTDEAQAVERLGLRPTLVQGSPFNVKVTRPEDLIVAARVLKMTEDTPMRVGQGFDVHAFGAGDHVVLGGVRIAHPKGVVAHSDGDVVIHALCDAVLGAMGDGDIGQHFPDSDERYRDANSLDLLRDTVALLSSNGCIVVHVDATVMLERPRLAPVREQIVTSLAGALGVSFAHVSIKATRGEGIGFVGREEGAAALAVATVDRQ